MRVTGREVRRRACGARFKRHHGLGRGVVIGGVVLACGFLSFWIPNGWSDSPPKGDEPHHHPGAVSRQKMTPSGDPVKQQSRLATPKGWRFTLPAGDPNAGRQVFVEFECYKLSLIHI